MAGINISLKDWLLGYIVANPTAGKYGSVGIPAVTLVDTTGTPVSGGGGGGAITSPLDGNGNVKTASFDSTGTAVTYNANGTALPANSSPVVTASPVTIANGQVAPTAVAATLLAARALRRQVTFKNIGAVTVYIGVATVTTANGLPLDPGESITLQSTALVQAITASGTGNVAYVEEY